MVSNRLFGWLFFSRWVWLSMKIILFLDCLPVKKSDTILWYFTLINKGQMTTAQNMVKWASDYFIKAHVAPNKLYGQVGDGYADHSYWGRPEDLTMARPVQENLVATLFGTIRFRNKKCQIKKKQLTVSAYKPFVSAPIVRTPILIHQSYLIHSICITQNWSPKIMLSLVPIPDHRQR